jgi:tetratricopeptide (TPR) repeat protein
MTERDIFIVALQKENPAERQAYLDEACAGQPDLRQQVGHLLRLHEGAGNFLEKPAVESAATGAFPDAAEQAPSSEAPGAFVGPHKLIEPIGEGGMGTVWMAQQTEPVKRAVAVKLIKPGMDSKQVLARFEAERQALALMDHANIARVLDAGTTGAGRPYFVMDLVKGVPITKYCDEHHLTPRQRLELFIPVCQAIQHAHQKGIIHRDLKPSNVLVALYDGKPVPKVIDFGVAKATGQQLTERTLVTGFGTVIGTLEYMSPEQAELNNQDIDTRSDIYSLGVILYELLTGSTPLTKQRLKETPFPELLRLIREEEAPKPSTRLSTTAEAPSVAANRGLEPTKLRGLVRGELDWIVMKALEKDRNRRYESANAFAMDVQRYLADEAVQACPPSAGYRLRKFARRNKSALAVAGLVLFFILLLGAGIGWAVRDRTAREQRLTGQVELILEDEDRLEREQRWPEALAAVGRAEAALAGGEAGEAIRRRVADARRDLAFVAELDRIRQESAAFAEGRFNLAGAARAYAAAFREYGVDVESLPTEEAVARLRGKPALAAPIAAALDNWVDARRELGEDVPSWKPLIAVARGLDPDPLRDRLRAAWGRPVTPESQAELRKLADSIDVKAQRPATLINLEQTLNGVQLEDAALRALQAGQYAYPADFWLNLELGKQLMERKDHAGSLRYTSVAVSLRPDSAAAHNNLGGALDGQGKLDEAAACFKKAIELDPKFAQAHSRLGAALGKQGKLDEALACFKKAIELRPRGAMDHANLGGVLCKQGKPNEAIAECRKAIELDPKCAPAHGNLGSALHDQGKLDDAVACYKKAIELDPKLANHHHNLGNALRDQGKLEEAIVCFRKATEVDPQYTPAHNNLGALLADCKHDDDGAIAEFRKAIELDPKTAHTHHNLGLILHRQGKLGEAIACFRKAITLDPNLAKAHSDLGVALHRQGKPGDAITCFRKAITLDPNLATAHSNLGRALCEQGKLDEAIACGRKAIDLDPKVALNHSNLGNTLLRQQKLDEAIACFQQAIQLDPKYAGTHGSLGLALYQQGKLEEAIACFQQAIQLDPKYAMGHNNLGCALDKKGQLGDAIVELRKAIELDPKDAWAPFNLGRVLYHQEKLDEAIACFKKAVELHPTFAQAHHALGICHAQLGLCNKAAAAYDRALELDPTNYDRWCSAAALHAAVGDVKGYRRACREMLKRFGAADQPQPAARMARACLLLPDALAAADLDRVQKLAERAVTGTEKDGAYDFFAMARGLAEYRAGRHDAAVKWMERSNPHTNGMHWDAIKFAVLAMAHHRLGRAKEAEATLAQATAIVAKMPDPAKGRSFGAGDWHDWLHAQVLWREADGLLKKELRVKDQESGKKPS